MLRLMLCFLKAYEECAKDFSDDMDDHLLLQVSYMYEDLLKTTPLKMPKWPLSCCFNCQVCQTSERRRRERITLALPRSMA